MTQTINRQPQGIPIGGQFAATTHGEPDCSLSGSSAPGVDEAVILKLVEARNGPGAVPYVILELAAAETIGGRELYLQRCDAIYNPDSEFTIDRSYGYAPRASECDALSDLGYTSVNQFAPEKMKRLRGVDSIISGGVTPDRLEVLDKLPTHEFQWSAWEKDAYLNAPVEDLDRVLSDKDLSRADKYIATVALTGTVDSTGEDRAARARRAIDLKIGDRGLIEATDHGLEHLMVLRDTVTESKRNAAHIVGLAGRGITGHHLKTYGAKACETFDAQDLEASTVPPKTLRSFLTSGVRMDLAGAKALHGAGYTAGNDLKAASKALGTTETKHLAKARKHATGAQMALFAAATRKDLRPDDLPAIARLNKAGITDPDQLKPWVAASHNRANQFVNRDQSILAVHADVIEAGITPERLGEMTRAGIPVDQTPAYTGSKNLWADGKQFRDAHDAHQEKQLATKWIRAVTPWAFTEDTYKDGWDAE